MTQKCSVQRFTNSASLWKCLWGFQRVGLGFLLIQPAVNPKQDRKRGAAEQFGEEPFVRQTQTALQCNAICSRLCWQCCHRPKRSAFLMLSRVRAQAGEWWRISPSPSSSGLIPVLSSLLRITLTLACPMDLKNFPMDVQTCIMQLESCESCAHPILEGRPSPFPRPPPCHLLPQLQPIPSPAFTACSRTSCLGLSFHSAHDIC